MTTPMPIIEKILQPRWNDTEANVLAAYQDTTSPDPAHKILIPPGVWMVRVTHDTRFALTPILSRGGAVITLPTITARAGIVEVTTESRSELRFALNTTPNTNDQNSGRIGVTLMRFGSA